MKPLLPFLLLLNGFFCLAQQPASIQDSTKHMDSLKVHVFGESFKKGERFKFYAGDNIYYKKITRSTEAFAFYIPIDTNTKDLDEINLSILRKARFGFKYRSVKLICHYHSDRKYFILYRDFRQRDKYCFIEHWSNVPFRIIKSEFWQQGFIPEWAKCDSIYLNTEAILNRKAVENFYKNKSQ